MKKVGIIGAGTMGKEIAAVFAGKAYDVILMDKSQQVLDNAKGEISGIVRFAKVFNKDREFCADTVEHITFTANLEDMKNVDMVIENVTENFEIKQEIYKQLTGICEPDTIFCVNTSCISITKIASLTDRPDKVIGIHFMNPVTRIHGAEVIRGYHTSDETLHSIVEILKSVDIQGIVIDDFPGFVSNRISHLMMNEAAFIVQDGYAKAEDVDNIFKKCYGHKMGPLETADLIGLDTVIDSLKVLYDSYQDPKFRVCPLLVKMVDAGMKGRKTGKGFYEYT